MPYRDTLQTVRRGFGREDEDEQKLFDAETLEARALSPFRPQSPPDPEEERKSKLKRLWNAFTQGEEGLGEDPSALEKMLTGPRGLEDALGGRPLDTPHDTPDVGPDAVHSEVDIATPFDFGDDDPPEDTERGPGALDRLGNAMQGATQRLIEVTSNFEQAAQEVFQSQPGQGVGTFGAMPPGVPMTDVEEQGDLRPVSDAMRMGVEFTGGAVDEMEAVGTGIPRLVEEQMPQLPGPFDEAIRGVQGGIASGIEHALTPMQRATETDPVEGTSDTHAEVAGGVGRGAAILASLLAGGRGVGRLAKGSELARQPGRLGKFARWVGETNSRSIPGAMAKDVGRFMPFDVASEAGDEMGGTIGFAAELADSQEIDTPLPELFGVEGEAEVAELARQSPGVRALGGVATSLGIGMPMAMIEGAIGASRGVRSVLPKNAEETVRMVDEAEREGRIGDLSTTQIKHARNHAQKANAPVIDKILAAELAMRNGVFGTALEAVRSGGRQAAQVAGSLFEQAGSLGRTVQEETGRLFQNARGLIGDTPEDAARGVAGDMPGEEAARRVQMAAREGNLDELDAEIVVRAQRHAEETGDRLTARILANADVASATAREVAGRGAAGLATAGAVHESDAGPGMTFAALAAGAAGSPKLIDELANYGFTRETVFPISGKARRTARKMTQAQKQRALEVQRQAVREGRTPPQVPFYPDNSPRPPFITVPEEDLLNHAMRGAEVRDWYAKQRELIEQFPEDEREFVAQLAGATSISTNPVQNFRETLEAYSRIRQNRPIRGLMKGKKEKIASALVHGDTEFSPKIWSYAKNLLGDERQATLDRWMHFAYRGEKDVFNNQDYGAAAAYTRQLANKLTETTGEEWTPAQVQAAIWFSVRSHEEDVWKMSQGVIPREVADGFHDAVDDAGLAIPLQREGVTEIPIGGEPGVRRAPDTSADLRQVRPERQVEVQQGRLEELNRPVNEVLDRLNIPRQDLIDFGSSRSSEAVRSHTKTVDGEKRPLQSGAFEGQSEANTVIRLPEKTADGEPVQPWMRKMVAAIASGAQEQDAAVWRIPRFPTDVEEVGRIFNKSGDEYMETARDLGVDGAFYGEQVVAEQFLTLTETDDLIRHLDAWYQEDPGNRLRFDFQHDKDHLWFGMYDDDHIRWTDDGPVPLVSPQEFHEQLVSALRGWDKAGVFDESQMKLAFADGAYLEPNDGRGWKGVFDDAYEEAVGARGEDGVPFGPGLYDNLVGRARTRTQRRTVPEGLRGADESIDTRQADIFGDPEAGAATREAVQGLGRVAGGTAIGGVAGGLADNERPGRGAAIGGALGAAAGLGITAKIARSSQTVAEDGTPTLRAISKGDDPKTWRERGRAFMEGLHELRRGVVDDVLPIRDLSKQLRNENSLDLADEARELERLVRVARGDQEYGLIAFEKGVHRTEELVGEGARKFRTRGLRSVVSDIGDRMNEFREYGLARRVRELRETDRPVPKLLDTPEARASQQAALERGDEQLERWFTEVQEIQAEWMRVLEEEGVIRSADDILETNQAYFPLFRDFDDLVGSGRASVEPTVGGSGVLQRPNLIKRIKGEQEAHRIIDPVESLVRLNYMFSNAIHRQRATNQLAKVADKLPEGNGLIEKAGPGEVSRAVRVSKDQLSGSIPEEVIEAMPEDFLTVFTPRGTDESNRLVRVLDEEGEASYYRLSEGMWDAVVGTSAEGLSPTMQLMLAPLNFAARTLRTMVTTIDPSFAFRNWFRDTNHVAITSKYKASGARGLAQAWGDAMGGLGVLLADAMPSATGRAAAGAGVGAAGGALADTDTGRGAAVGAVLGATGGTGMGRIGRKFAARAGMTPEEVVDVFRSSGAMQAAFLSMDRKAIQKSLKDAIRAGQGSKPLKYANPFEALRGFGMAFENANRVGEMVRILEAEGKDPSALVKAAEQTRDVSIDFARHGAWKSISVLRQMAAFWNARVQGYDKIVRAFRDPETRGRAAKVAFGGLTAPSLALYALNRENEDYWERPLWERNLFWLVPLPEAMGSGFLRIPKPFELGLVFGSSFERMFEAVDPKNPENGNDWTETLPEAPANFARSIEEELSGSFFEMVTPMPTGLQPFWENRVNENWNGIPVVPPFEDLQRKPDWLKGADNASDLGNSIGRWLDVPPPQVDNALTAWTGRMGWQTLQQYDKFRDQLDPESGPAPKEHFRDGFLVRSFFSEDPPSNPRSVTRLYEKLNEAESSWNAVKQLESRDRSEEALDVLNENADAMRGLDALRDAAEQMKELRDFAADIEDGEGFAHLSAEQKRAELDRIRREILDISRSTLESIEGR